MRPSQLRLRRMEPAYLRPSRPWPSRLWPSRESVGKAGSALRRIVGLLMCRKAQATVEYLIVALGILAVIIGMAALGGRLQEGLFPEHAAESASHATTTNTAGSIGDVLLY